MNARYRGKPVAVPKQRGLALVAVLLLMMVAMLMALAALRSVNLEERMASHTRDRQVAFQMAEAALRDGEQTIAANTNGPFLPLRPGEFTAACTGGLCRSTPGGTPAWVGFSEADWQGAKTWAYGAATGAAALAGAATAPRMVIEYQGTTQPVEPGKPCVALFLITARARGATMASEVILQSVYRHRSGECYAAI